MKCLILISCVIAAVHTASYELIPALEYDGEVYIPLSQIRTVRAADPRHFGYNDPVGGSQADATAASNSQTYNNGGFNRNFGGPWGGYGGKGGYGPGGYGPGGRGYGPGTGGYVPGGRGYGPGTGGYSPGAGGNPFGASNSNAGAKAGASGNGSGNSDSTANAQTQTFNGNGFSGSASSSSASSHSSGGGGGGYGGGYGGRNFLGGDAGSNAAAAAQSNSKT